MSAFRQIYNAFSDDYLKALTSKIDDDAMGTITATKDTRFLHDYLVKMDFLGYRLCSISKDNNQLFIVKHYNKTQ